MTEGEEGRATEWRLSARCHSAPPTLVILSPHCHSVPPIVILSAAKNLPSRLRGMARKILRRSAPQNDRGEKPAPQNDSSLVILRPTPCSVPPIVILSEAKNLPSSAAEKGPT